SDEEFLEEREDEVVRKVLSGLVQVDRLVRETQALYRQRKQDGPKNPSPHKLDLSLRAKEQRIFDTLREIGLNPGVIEKLALRLKQMVLKVVKAERELQLWSDHQRGKPEEFQDFLFGSLEHPDDGDLLNT